MKKTLLLLFIGITAFTKAQNLTLTKSGYEPIIGDTKGVYPLDTTFYTSGLPVSATGTAATWDFSNLILNPTVTLNSSNYVAPSSTTVTPPSGATIAEDQGGSYNFYKSVTTPTTQTEILSVKFGTIALTFTNSGIVARYPISYGYSLSDAIGGNITFSISAQFSGNITTTADGMGTLLMPQGNTFNNVLRVKSVQTITATVFSFPVGNLNQTSYSYFHASSKFPILTINQSSTTFSTNTTKATTASGNSSFLTIGLKENSLNVMNFNVYPNPAIHSIYIDLENNKTAESITLINTLGQKLKTTLNSNEISVSDMPRGIYYIEVNSSGHIGRKPIVIAQ